MALYACINGSVSVALLCAYRWSISKPINTFKACYVRPLSLVWDTIMGVVSLIYLYGALT